MAAVVHNIKALQEVLTERAALVEMKEALTVAVPVVRAVVREKYHGFK